MSEKCYRIAEWDTTYENAQSRKCKKVSWVPVPNKHDGAAYRRIAAMKNGAEIFAAWILILQVASKCPKRGLLANSDGIPYDAEDLSLKTGFPKRIFEKALQILSQHRISWLVVDWERPASTPDTFILEQNRTEQKEGNEQKELADEDDADECSIAFDTFWKPYPKKLKKKEAWKSWKKENCEHLVDEICASVEAHKETDQWQNDMGKYIPYPSTFLNQHRWMDTPEIEVPERKSILRP